MLDFDGGGLRLAVVESSTGSARAGESYGRGRKAERRGKAENRRLAKREGKDRCVPGVRAQQLGHRRSCSYGINLQRPGCHSTRGHNLSANFLRLQQLQLRQKFHGGPYSGGCSISTRETKGAGSKEGRNGAVATNATGIGEKRCRKLTRPPWC